MKILLSEKNDTDRERYQEKLDSWGFIVIKDNRDVAVIKQLENNRDIQALIIGESDDNLHLLLAQIRKLDQYIYVIALLSSEKQSLEIEGHDVRADCYFEKSMDLNRLRYQLQMAKMVICYSFDFLPNLRKPIFNKERQVLNLKQALKCVNQNRPQLKKQLDTFIRDASAQLIMIENSNKPIWQELLQASENLGAGQISDYFTGLLFLKSNPDYFSLINHNLLQHRFHEVLIHLVEGISCLDKFGFFSEEAQDKDTDLLDNKIVLLVEDMKYNRVLLRKILEKHNCRIVEAVNGKDAVDCWSENRTFDLIIMDMNMPVMDGFAATKKIREIEARNSLKRTPVIALTALAMRGDRELCIEAGTDDYLPKPVEAHSLINICEKLLSDKNEINRKKNWKIDIQIKKVLIKTNHQIYLYLLETIFKKLGIDYDYCNEEVEILEKVASKKFDLVILEADYDLELAYFIKNNLTSQSLALITTLRYKTSPLLLNSANNLHYPFSFEQVSAVIKKYSDQLIQAKKQAEKLADVDSLSKIKGEININEAVQNSNQQLAVWQKAFRKIGGDLVISHQFNMHGRFGFILGDVAGHDIQSGYTASWFSGLVKGVWRQNANPFEFLLLLNNLFPHETEEENKRFVCSLVLLWDPIRRRLQYSNAGIPGGIIIKKDTGKAEMIEWTGVPIGMFPDMDMFDQGEIEFNPGDRLIMATDGVLEAIPGEIISGLSESKSDKPPQDALDAIVDFVTRSIEITDDLTIAVFEAKQQPIPEKGYRESIPSTFKDVDQAMINMEEFIQNHAPEQFDWMILSMAVREALINAVEHGNKKNPDIPVDIDLELLDDRLVVTVSDWGSGFDLSHEKKRLAKEGELRIHGRGIEMMENIGLSLSYLGGGARLEFAKKE